MKEILSALFEARVAKEEAVRKEREAFEALSGFESSQKRMIRFGFDRGLTVEQVSVYADPAYRWEQMCEIRLGFEDGLSIAQVRSYADPSIPAGQMYERRLALGHAVPSHTVGPASAKAMEKAQSAPVCAEAPEPSAETKRPNFSKLFDRMGKSAAPRTVKSAAAEAKERAGEINQGKPNAARNPGRRQTR